MKFYLSHPIRGFQGKNATHVDMEKNCDKAILIANLIRNAIPSIEIYCPAEHEFPPVGYFLQKGYVTTEQVLDVDCTIINNCDGVIIYNPHNDALQGGCLVEYNHAVATHQPIWLFSNVEILINQLAEFILHI